MSENQTGLYPQNFLYKIIFYKPMFDPGVFLSKLTEAELDFDSAYSVKECSDDKYITLTVKVFLKNEFSAEQIDKLICGTEGVINYFSMTG